MKVGRLVALVVLGQLLVAACGARLTDEQREVALGSFDAGPAIASAAPVAAEDRGDGEPVDALGRADAEPIGLQSIGDGQQAGTSPARTPDATDSRLTASDTGVTEDRIIIANVSDISGAVPGLFADVQFAAQAYVAMFNATEGRLHGRTLELRALDAGMSQGQNRNRYIQACDEAFAAVGSMSAFEQGAAPVIEECRLPDLRAAAVTPSVMRLDTMYSLQPLSPTLVALPQYHYWAEREPEAIAHAAYLYIDSETTQFQTRQIREATSQIGYEWVYVQQIAISETNYAPFVLEMRRRGVEYVTFQGDYRQAARLAQAMRQQEFWPTVYALQANAYTPEYIAERGPDVVEGTEVVIPSVMLEEIDRHPEMQRYAEWLGRVRPGQRPTGLGIYGWAAGFLFTETAAAVGPELTRERLLAQLTTVKGFDANGLIPPQDIGGKQPAGCVVVVVVRDGGFRRLEPAGDGMRCDARRYRAPQ